jgi:hypothetical protein
MARDVPTFGASQNTTTNSQPPNYGTNGFLSMFLMNRLTSSETTINPVYFKVYVSSGSDFQLMGLDNRFMSNVGTFNPQMAGELETELKPPSMRRLMEANYPSITGDNSGFLIEKIHSPLVINSFKQIISALSFYANSGTSTAGYDTTLCGYFPSSEVMPYMSTNYLYLVGMTFRYFRGSLRFYCVPLVNTSTTLTQVLYYYTLDPTATPVLMKTLPNLQAVSTNPYDASQGSAGLIIFNGADTTLQREFNVPYQSIYRCNPTLYQKSATASWPGVIDWSGGYASVYTYPRDLNGSAMAGPVSFFMFGNDDFLFGF